MASDDETIIGCMRVAWGGLVVQGVQRRRCDRCNAEIWVSPVSLAAVTAMQAKLRCLECCGEIKVDMLLPGQAEEIARAFRDLDKESN